MSSPSSLRPAWHRGRSGGFQPPPAVASERPQAPPPNQNKFAALDEDDADLAELEQQAEEAALRSTKKGGRSLADLARERSGSYASSEGSTSRLASNYTTTTTTTTTTAAVPANNTNVIRYTRERLLSMRPSPLQEPKFAVADAVVVSEQAQDPVCFDTFEPEAIWAQAAQRRSSKVLDETQQQQLPQQVRRTSSRRSTSEGQQRWQRGVALPPPERKSSRSSNNHNDAHAEKPSDLWDDPQATGAAADFSAFGGGMPDDDAAFDFEKMAEATAKFEEELHGRSRASTEEDGTDLGSSQQRRIDSHRPLASTGTTIQSGSGDNVNVFEDFDEPGAEPVEEDKKEQQPQAEESASSKLMAMIGVKKESGTTTDAWLEPPEKAAAKADPSVPLNPWGGPLLPGQGDAQPGFELQARLREAEMEKARQEEIARTATAKRLAEEQARHQQQQEQARHQQQQQQQAVRQQDGVQSQVELVLIERISAILENSWGQSDLSSILSTLHAEDSRVIPLLNNTDALRALILRNPQRIAIRANPVFGTEMAALLLTNAQWQQQQAAQQQEAAMRSQEEERQRLLEQQQRQLHQRTNTTPQIPAIVEGAPWYYSDPQNNIQGPFRGGEMRQWLEAGYFKADLPISQQQTGPFLPLSAIFPDLSVAFAPDQNAKEQAARLEAERAAEAEKLEAQRKAEEAAERERQRQAEEERKARAEEAAAAAAAEVEAAKKSAVVNESSNQLKMMLGVTGASEPAPKENAPSTKSSSKNGQQKKPQEAPAPQPKAAAPPAPAWGGANKPVTRKSMSEIQKEEARAAAIAAMNRENDFRSSSSGWANIAASRGGSNGWQGGSAQRPAAAVVQKQGAASGQKHRASQPQLSKVAAANAQLSNQRTQTSSTNAAEEFGANMSPALEKWCKDQMMKLNGTEDLTLVSFCMTLTDPVEIRQYLTTYLGSNAQVNNFATEFINKKSGAKAQEEWESTAVVKKSRKKKVGGR